LAALSESEHRLSSDSGLFTVNTVRAEGGNKNRYVADKLQEVVINKGETMGWRKIHLKKKTTI